MTVLGKVTPVPAAGLVRRPANFFDLQGKTVTFTPEDAGAYSVRTGPLTWVETSSRVLLGVRDRVSEPPGPFDHTFGHARVAAPSSEASASVGLPFAFPFAGRKWTRVHANTNGNVSFAAPEAIHWEERDPWADGTMRSVAAAVDSRSAAGLEAMIAVLWAYYDEWKTSVSVDSAPTRVAITWDAVASSYESLGPNEFQVRLFPSGAIEFAYRQVSERDGIVGLFHGTDARGETLSAVEDAVGDVSNDVVDIVSAKLVDNGSTVVASVTMAADIPARVSSGEIEYRVFLDFDGKSCGVGLAVTTTGRRGSSWCGAAPSVVGYRVRGATLEIPISKTFLSDARTVSWSDMDAVWWGRDVFDYLDVSQRVYRDEWGHDLSSRARTVAGNVFEVFHYPSVTKQMREITSFVYEQVPDDDEIVVLFTDFRTDDLFNTGPGSGPINVPVQGIGDWQAVPTPGSEYGSDSLLVTMSPVFVGGPNFRESGFDGAGRDRNHAIAVYWIAHEAIHRWAAHLRFRNPQSGRIESLADDWCGCHWNNFMHAPVVHPVWREFADQPYPEASIMGGALWLDHGDGTFTWQGQGGWKAAGLSALDLYVMGMIPPEEVGPTFLLRDPVETGTEGRYRATKVPVRIEDIVAAMGPRVPSAADRRREFRLGVYLLHEGRAPRADLLARTRGITDAVVEYFRVATGADAAAPPVTPDPPPGDGACVAGEETLCLQNGRFEVRTDWWTAGGEPAPAVVVPKGTDDSGLFRFFDPANWEILIKVLDGCAVNGHHWVYGASTTDLGYAIRVRDTKTGDLNVYRNEPGQPARAITDNKAFQGGCEGGASSAVAFRDWGLEGARALELAPVSLKKTSQSGCVDSGTALCLADSRFEVTVDWSSADGKRGTGGAVPGTSNSGLFYFFDSSNWEMLIKVLDGCGVNGHHWVYAAAATDLGLDITVTDTVTGSEWTYSENPGAPAPAITESKAFPNSCRP